MDFLYSKLRQLRIFGAKQEPPCVVREVTKFEGYLQLIYKILTWDDVSLTLTVFLLLNFIFWLVIQLELRCFGVMFLLALVAFIADSYLEDNPIIRAENKHLEAVDQLKTDIRDSLVYLQSVRNNNRSSFGIIMTLFFICLSVVARTISGYILFYLVLLAIFFTPLAIQKIPEEYTSQIKLVFRSFTSDRGVLAEDELIPYISEKDFDERDNDQDSLLTADSVSNSLITGLSSMPSHMDADDKDSLPEEDLMPSGAISFTPGDSTDSESDHREMRFSHKHFHVSGSSSEEDSFGKPRKLEAQQRKSQVFRELLEAGSAMLESVRQAALSNPQQQRKESSSDSDFEIIDTQDLEH